MKAGFRFGQREAATALHARAIKRLQVKGRRTTSNFRVYFCLLPSTFYLFEFPRSVFPVSAVVPWLAMRLQSVSSSSLVPLTNSEVVMNRDGLIVRFCACLFIALTLCPTAAEAQNRLGGHFGIVFPLLTHAHDETTTISEDFLVGFPTGITVRTSDRIAFDLELVPVIQNEPLGVSLTVHPGILIGVADRTTFGVRMAFDVDRPSWGFTPLLNYSLGRLNGAAIFGELVVPIRFQEDRDNFTSIGLGIHFGVGF